MTPTEAATLLRQLTYWRRGVDVDPPKPGEIFEAIDAAIAMIERLEAAEEDRSNFLLEMGRLCAQCDALRLRIKAAEKERDALRAKVAEMEQQEPVAWTAKLALEHRANTVGFRVSSVNIWGENGVPLYALPGAQTQGEEK